MLHICPRLPHQPFLEPPFEDEILAFLCFLGHSGAIGKLTDVNINKLHQPWRSFAAIINKCLTGKSSGYDSLRFVYQVEHKDTKKSNEMYYPRFTKVAMTEAQQLNLATKRSLQQTHISQASGSGVDEGTRSIPGVPDDDDDDGDDGKEGDGDDDDEDEDGEEGNDDDDDQEDDWDDDKDDEEKGNDDEQASDEEEFIHPSLSTHTEEEPRDEERMESIFKTTSQMDVQTLTSVAPLPMSAPTITPSTIATITATQQAPILPIIASSTLLQDLPNFGSLFGFNNRLKTLEAKLSKFMQMNQFARAVFAILEIVKEQVKVQVSKILPKIEQTMNEQLEAEFLTRSSNSSKTSYAVAADLSEMELKKILIEKIEGNKSIQRSNEQRNLYKALVKSYESDKIILDTYGDSVTLKKRRDDDADKDEEPSAGSDRGSKRYREGKEPESTSASESATSKEPMQTTFEIEEPSHLEFEIGVMQKSGRAQILVRRSLQSNDRSIRLVNPEGHQYPHNLLKPLPLIPNNRGHRVIPFDHFINKDLEYLCGGASSRKYTTYVTKTKATYHGYIKWIEDLVPRTIWTQEPIGYDKHALWGISHWGRKRQQFYGFAVNRESARDVYSKCRIIAVTELKIVEWHNYKHLDWITMRRDDDKLYKFKEGDFKRLRIQDIEDMLLLLIQEKLTNLTVEERFAFNVSLRMFTRSIVIQRRVEDLQLGVESYQKKLNLTKPDKYRSVLKRKEAYIAYSNPRGFIYQNKDKQNKLMRIDELHKFSDGTLIDVRTT
uniref:Uncharacterized protein n=1 Tax=Tanacetum cinerariifolium TaxID=118510 RepID=A0A6L2KAC2_TANCI|nr:hypothetical protein [Tanacetum cinerariifolium]